MKILGYDISAAEVLITANVFAFLMTSAIPSEILFNNLSLRPVDVFNEPWTIITSMFLHAGFNHILFNMIALFFFGLYLERMIGEKRFLRIYFTGGLVGSLAYLFTSFAFNMPPPTVAAVGASGAIFAIMGVLVVLKPKMMIFVYFIPMPLYVFATLYTVWAFIEMLSSIGIMGGVAHNAHLGGLIVGLYFGRQLKKEMGYGEDTYGYRIYR